MLVPPEFGDAELRSGPALVDFFISSVYMPTLRTFLSSLLCALFNNNVNGCVIKMHLNEFLAILTHTYMQVCNN